MCQFIAPFSSGCNKISVHQYWTGPLQENYLNIFFRGLSGIFVGNFSYFNKGHCKFKGFSGFFSEGTFFQGFPGGGVVRKNSQEGTVHFHCPKSAQNYTQHQIVSIFWMFFCQILDTHLIFSANSDFLRSTFWHQNQIFDILRSRYLTSLNPAGLDRSYEA